MHFLSVKRITKNPPDTFQDVLSSLVAAKTKSFHTNKKKMEKKKSFFTFLVVVEAKLIRQAHFISFSNNDLDMFPFSKHFMSSFAHFVR